MPNNWMWSAVAQALLGLRGFPYHLELISRPFVFFSFFCFFDIGNLVNLKKN
jgi:hypothetical protein